MAAVSGTTWAPDTPRSPARAGDRGRSALVLLVADDRGELLGLEAGAPDERTVDVVLNHDRRDVPGLHRASVQHPDGVRDVPAVALGEPFADGAAHLLGVLRR